MSDEEDNVSDWVLERFLLGELPPPQARWIDGLLPARPDLVVRLETLRRSNTEILATFPPRSVKAAVDQRMRTSKHRVWTASLAASLATVFMVGAFVAFNPTLDGERTKGSAQLGIHRQTDRGSERLADGALVQPGDSVQIVFSAGNGNFATVVSIDGNGQVTRHFPVSGDSAVSGLNVAVPTAFQLDDAPGFERFVLVASTSPIDVEGVLAEAARVAAGTDPAHEAFRLSKDLDWSDVLLRKPEP